MARDAAVKGKCRPVFRVARIFPSEIKQMPVVSTAQCYMYCLWEQFGLVDDKRELSLNGMLTFFQRIPAYRAEVQKAITECKGIGKYLGIYRVYFILLCSSRRPIGCFRSPISFDSFPRRYLCKLF